MIEGPLGGAAFNNEFGRPNLAGYFRTFELEVDGAAGREVRGYHKPIMVAGGLGNVRAEHGEEGEIPAGAPHRRAGRPGDADRPGRRRGLVAGLRRLAARISISRPCSATTPRCSGAARRSSTAAGALGDRQPDPLHPRRRRGRPLERAARAGARQRAAARIFACAPSPATSPGCRRWSCGATRRRSATCWRSRPSASPTSRRSARASAARTPSSGEATDDGVLVLEDRAARRRSRRHAARGAARQAAAHDARRATRRRRRSAPLRLRGDRPRARPRGACCGCRRSPTRPS